MITLICGPMFSGKSTELIRQLERKHIAGKRVLYVRPNADSRDFIARGYKGDLSDKADIKRFSSSLIVISASLMRKSKIFSEFPLQNFSSLISNCK